MLSGKDVAVFYETLLMSPGMSDGVKITLKVQRRNVLLLAKAIELGLETKGDAGESLLLAAGRESLEDLRSLSREILESAGMTEIYERMNLLQPK